MKLIVKCKSWLKQRDVLQLRAQQRNKSTRAVEKSVVVSTSQDIYTNLALEDWFYRNLDFSNKQMLMMWMNKPCVVIDDVNDFQINLVRLSGPKTTNLVKMFMIRLADAVTRWRSGDVNLTGKFQNPWLECNVPNLNTLIPEGVRLARRNSGGGTVYHDLGNLNLTFFTSRGDYKRKRNLEVITRAILHRFGLKIDISKREDLVFGEFKVSGTAAKLGRTSAYHHCTLLVDANQDILSRSLHKPDYDIATNATQSIRSQIKNLSHLDANIKIDELINCISEEYLSACDIKHVVPSEEIYPGILDIRDELKSFDWVFGKCPNFYASKQVILENNTDVTVKFTIEKGLVSQLQLQTDNILNFDLYVEQFKDRKFDENLFNEIVNLLNAEVENLKLTKHAYKVLKNL